MDPARRLALEALGSVVDPETGLDLVSMGLVYGLDLEPRGVRLRMTLTTPGCPLGPSLVEMAKSALQAAAPGRAVDVELVWDPPWSPWMLAQEAKERL